MRTLFSLLSLVFLIQGTTYSQQTITATIQHDGGTREYILYIPASYTGIDPFPLVLNFHGYGSNAAEQMWYGDFRAIADTANFLIVHPLGTLHNNSTTHFNVGGFTLGSTTDDVGFTAALIDSLSVQYTIDQDRIYSTGMSNGGFMSFVLACQLSDRIAAIASVTGSMTPETFATCDPEHPMPILQMHGTSDGVVPYSGALWTKSINDVVNYWVEFNNCTPDPTTTLLPNVNTQDGSTVEHIVYASGDNKTTMEHYKVTGGGHTWPGTIFTSNGTNQDMNASLEIWRFFSRYTLSGLTMPTSVLPTPNDVAQVTLTPNPAKGQVLISRLPNEKLPYTLVSLAGQLLQSGTLQPLQDILDLPMISSGYYLLKIGHQSYPLLISE